MENERKNKITYRKEGDYNAPNLVIPKDEYADYHIGKYGHLRLSYLKENKKAEYTIMLVDGTLRKHIVETDMAAKSRVESIVSALKNQSDLTDEIKLFQRELYGIANNINQIARIANSKFSISHDNFENISKSVTDFILRFEKKVYSRQK